MTTLTNLTKKDILKDVIARLDADKIVPLHSTYILFNSEDLFSQLSSGMIDINASVKEVLDRRCATCMVGAMFLSAVDKDNKLKMSYLEEPQKIFTYLEEFFDYRELHLMELVYEGGDVNGYFAPADRDCVKDMDDEYEKAWSEFNALMDSVEAFRSTASETYKKSSTSEAIIRGIVASTIKHGVFDPTLEW